MNAAKAIIGIFEARKPPAPSQRLSTPARQKESLPKLSDSIIPRSLLSSRSDRAASSMMASNSPWSYR
jgi:hypothetical protein